MAYELIETIEVGAGGASVLEFQSIPQDGVDLLILLSARTSVSNYYDSTFIYVNGNYPSGADGRGRNLIGTGSSVSSSDFGGAPGSYDSGSTSTSNVFGNASIYISNYASSGTTKSLSVDAVTENNATSARQLISAGLQEETSGNAITSIYLNCFDTYQQYSTASLYKIY